MKRFLQWLAGVFRGPVVEPTNCSGRVFYTPKEVKVGVGEELGGKNDGESFVFISFFADEGEEISFGVNSSMARSIAANIETAAEAVDAFNQ